MRTFIFGFFLFFYLLLTPILLFPYLLIFPFSRVKAKSYVSNLLSFTIKIIFKLLGIHLIVKGMENFPTSPSKPLMIIANHQSSWDIIVLLAMAIRPIGFISKKEVMWFFPLNLWMLTLDCVFLDRKSPRKALLTMNKVANNLNKGDVMCIFPEGTRSKGKADMLPFKRGSFKPVYKTESAVLPVTIEGSYKSWESEGKVQPSVIYLTFHPLIETKQLPEPKRELLPEETWEVIHNELESIKSLPEIPLAERKKGGVFYV